jgi:Na+/glutamate symporter
MNVYGQHRKINHEEIHSSCLSPNPEAGGLSLIGSSHLLVIIFAALAIVSIRNLGARRAVVTVYQLSMNILLCYFIYLFFWHNCGTGLPAVAIHNTHHRHGMTRQPTCLLLTQRIRETYRGNVIGCGIWQSRSGPVPSQCHG